MDKRLALLGVSVGSLIGGYLPSLFGAGPLSAWGIVTGGAGALVGLWLMHRLSGS